MPVELILAPQDLDLNEKFHIKPFKYTKGKLTGPEKSLLRKRGTKLQAFEDRMASSKGTKYQHFMAVCEDKAEPSTNEERVWVKYRAMLEDEKRLKEQRRKELISSRECDDIKSRFVP